MRLLAAMLILIGLTSPIMAQEAQDLEALTRAEAEARKTEARLKSEREAVTREIARLKTELVNATEQTRAFERESQRLTERLSDIETRITALQNQLTENRQQTQDLLASLQRLQMAPNIVTYADPDNAVKTAQAASMIDLLSAELDIRAQETLRLAGELSDNRVVAATRQRELDANSKELTRRRGRTQALVAEKEKLRASLQSGEEKARADAARLAAESATLRELLEKISEAARDVTPRLKPGQPNGAGPVTLPPGTVRFSEAKGGLIRPVSGRMTSAFGRGERGQTYSAPTGGQVLAPYAGRVEFSGPFKTYDNVVILNMDDGYFLLLTGLGQTFVSAGETVKRGEPVGQMPNTGSRAPLYLELRQNGRTIDPAPWMS